MRRTLAILAVVACSTDPPVAAEDIADVEATDVAVMEEAVEPPADVPADVEEPVDMGCAPGPPTCSDGQTVETCVAGELTLSTCQADTLCDGGECLPVICSPGTPLDECSTPSQYLVCNATGTRAVAVDCGPGLSCYQGQCLALKCVPDSVACTSPFVLSKCAADGSGFEVLKACDKGGFCDSSSEPRCVSACDADVKSKLYRGCEFWAADLDNIEGGQGEGVGVVVSIPADVEDADVTITDVATGDVVGEATVAAGALKVFLLPSTSGQDGSKKSISSFRIVTTAPATVHQFNPLNASGVFTQDASLLLPGPTLGTTYSVMSWPHREDDEFTLRGFASVIGTAEGFTQVVVKARADVMGGGPGSGVPAMGEGDVKTFQLQQGEVLNLETAGPHGADLTGTWITADKPIAVFGGHECGNVPLGVTACDHLEQQLLPTTAWGVSSKVIAVPFAKRSDGQQDVWRIVGGAPDVKVTTDPPQPGYASFTLHQGTSVTFASAEAFVITATGPALVGHFLSGSAHPGFETACGHTGLGDPAFTLGVPVQQFLRRYTVLSPAGYSHGFIDITAKLGTTVELDGQPITEPLTAVDADWGFARVAVEPGVHKIESLSKIGVTVYGYDCDVSYAYPGGLTLQKGGFDEKPPETPPDPPEPKVPSGDKTDGDNDGVVNDVDNCPAIANPSQDDQDLDGDGDACDEDIDGDGVLNALDCAPKDKNVAPGVVERCDGFDNNCDQATDDEGADGCQVYYPDFDLDGFGPSAEGRCLCAADATHVVSFGGDCDDTLPALHPWAREVCNGLDDDCDGQPDDGCDVDGDGYCGALMEVVGSPAACPKGGGDCVDLSAAIHPGAAEVPGNFLDDDCDGIKVGEAGPGVSDCTGQPCLGQSVEALLCSLELCFPGYDLVGPATVGSPAGTPTAQSWDVVAHYGDPGNDLAPRAGSSYLLLSTGIATSTVHNTILGGGPLPDPYGLDKNQTYDSVEVSLELTAPPTATGFTLEYIFLSAEYPEFVGETFNDRFYAVLTAPQTTGGLPTIVNFTGCSDPAAYFDFIDTGKKLCYIAINSAFSEPCPAATNIDGTGYQCDEGSSTGWLKTSWPIQPGETFTLLLHIHDTADGKVDSSVILDNFRWETEAFEKGTKAASN